MPDRFSVVVLSAKTPDHSHIEKYQGARLLRVPVGSGDLASRIQAFERAVRRQLESEEYALAHFTDPFGGYALCEMKADYGYRLIYEAQTFPSQELRYTHPQTEGDRRFLSKVRRQELFCLMNADLIITGSRTTRAHIQSLGASEELIHVLRAPVDLQPYAPDVLGIPDGQPLRLMYLGSQVGWQGLPTLLRAMALAVRQADVRLTLVGARHADWQPHLDDLVKELGLQERVEFQPPVAHDDLAKVLALADVGVLPMDDVERNRQQGGPLAKVSEYFAAGRPVIAADLPVTRELIPPGTALFFPPGDTQALAQHIVELARDVPRRVELGRKARAHAEEVLDAGLIRGKLLDLYDSLLDKRSVPVAPRGEDDLPSPTTVTGTPTNRLAALLPPEGTPVTRKPEPPGTRASAPPASNEPSREELPLVMGQVLDEGVDTRLVKTELEEQPSGPPVVMGLPLRESAPSPSTVEVSESLSSMMGETASPTSGRADTGAGEPPSLAEEPPTPAIRSSGTSGDEEPPAPTPVVRAPAAPEEPPAPTPVVRAPASIDSEEPPAPTPVVRAPAPPDSEEPPAPTPITRAPGPYPREEAPFAAFGARAPLGATREEPPAPAVRGSTREEAPTPVAFRATVVATREDAPASTGRSAVTPYRDDEPPAPTPIVKVPEALLMREESLTQSSTSRASSPSRTSIPALSSRSTSARVETPSRRIAPLATPSRGTSAIEPERPRASSQEPAPLPPIRGGAASSEPALPPAIRGGASASEPERSRSSTQETALPPVIRGGPPSQETVIPPVLRAAGPTSDMERPRTPTQETVLPPVIRGGASASEPERPPPVLRPSAASTDGEKLPQIRGGLVTSELERPPALPPRAAAPPPVPRQRPPQLTPTEPPRLTPVSRPVVPPSLKASVPAAAGTEDEPEEISEDEAQPIDDGTDGTATPAHSRPRLDEPDEISSDEVEDAEVSATGAARLLDEAELHEVESEQAPVDEGPAPEPVPSSLNPWFAQLAHGYCPPDGIRFDRPTPPTTFPGRDEDTQPSRQPPTRAPGVVRGKSS
ncbi:glycosyltransferase [Myxococcus sp. RHSTA-1-4]|uniref:glycosyltransferase family 4 protein n=1 Tax=Myxococcus sp. RHSTA-1-4 TaxID=2874601 RepID=UPI00351CDF41